MVKNKGACEPVDKDRRGGPGPGSWCIQKGAARMYIIPQAGKCAGNDSKNPHLVIAKYIESDIIA